MPRSEVRITVICAALKRHTAVSKPHWASEAVGSGDGVTGKLVLGGVLPSGSDVGGSHEVADRVDGRRPTQLTDVRPCTVIQTQMVRVRQDSDRPALQFQRLM